MANLKKIILLVALVHTQLSSVYSTERHFISRCHLKDDEKSRQLTFHCTTDESKSILETFVQNPHTTCDNNKRVEFNSVNEVSFAENCKFEYLPDDLLSKFSGLEKLTIESIGLKELREKDLPNQGRSNIKSLNLSGNNLEVFNPASLQSLSSLETLYLKDNDITGLMPFPAFRQLSSIILIQNKIAQISSSTFDQLPELSALNLQENQLKSALIHINTEAKLSTLVLSSNPLGIIHVNDFAALTNLQNLHLDHAQLKTIEADAFAQLGNLRFLDLSWNEISEIQAGVFNGLYQLDELQLSSNQLKTTVLQFDANNRLRVLNMSYNQLGELQQGNFAYLYQLEVLDLSNSHVTNIKAPTLNELNRLDILDLSHNDIIRIEPFTFFGNGLLNTLLLQNNKLSTADIFFCKENHLEVVDLSGNSIEVLRVTDFKILRALKELSLSKLPLQRIELGTFSSLIKLEKLDLSGNALKKLDFHGFLPVMTSLTTLTLNDNRLTELDSHFDQIFPKLEELLITQNKFNCSYLAGFLRTLRKHPNAVDKNPSYEHKPNIGGIICEHLEAGQPEQQPQQPTAFTGAEPKEGEVTHQRGFSSGYNVSIFVLLLWISLTNLVICGAMVLAARKAAGSQSN